MMPSNRLSKKWWCEQAGISSFTGTRFYSKYQWKVLVWKRAWEVENQDWEFRATLFKATKTIASVSDNGRLLIWWQLAGVAPEIMKQCEVLVKLVCQASQLKSDSHQFRKDTVRRTYCELCTEFAVEDARHIILNCPALQCIRRELFYGISMIENNNNVIILDAGHDTLATILGLRNTDIDVYVYTQLLRLVADCVYRMYNFVLRGRDGIG